MVGPHASTSSRRSHVRTLMAKMGIEALYQKPHSGHTIYPYPLRGVTIATSNTAWASDITYIPMAKDAFIIQTLPRSLKKGLEITSRPG